MAPLTFRPVVCDRDGLAVIRLRQADIWDHSDLTLIRDTLVQLIAREGRSACGVDMSHVKRLPSGYFGLLMDYCDRGIEVYLIGPQQNVREMRWFQMFALPTGEGMFRLRAEPQESVKLQERVGPSWTPNRLEAAAEQVA